MQMDDYELPKNFAKLPLPDQISAIQRLRESKKQIGIDILSEISVYLSSDKEDASLRYEIANCLTATEPKTLTIQAALDCLLVAAEDIEPFVAKAAKASIYSLHQQRVHLEPEDLRTRFQVEFGQETSADEITAFLNQMAYYASRNGQYLVEVKSQKEVTL